jgi:acyl-CoA thioester hydrolase
MAKPEPWRLKLDAYPFQHEMDTRFQDLDTLAHINNVAMAAMFETARVRFNVHTGRHPQTQGVRWLVAAVELNYLHEAHFPAPMLIGCGLGKLGNSSWTILAAAFQHGICVATCDTVMVSHGPEGRRRISDETRAAIAEFAIRGP